MSSSQVITDILARARRAQAAHKPLPLFPEMAAASKVPHTVTISCADPRANPEQIFQLDPSDGIIIFRTIAGHPQTTLNGILALDHALRIDDILILHHSDCGSTYWTEDDVKEALKDRCPTHRESIESMVFGATENSLEENLKEDVEWLKASPLMRTELATRIRGFMWDVQAGTLVEIEGT